MIYGLFLLFPLVLSAYCLFLDLSPVTIFMSAAAWASAAVGLMSRRFSFIVLSGALLFFEFVSVALGDAGTSKLWSTLLFVLGVFLLLELGHDCTVVSRARLVRTAYRLKARYLLFVIIGSPAVVFLIATIAYNAPVIYPRLNLSGILLPALVILIGGIGFIAARIAAGIADTRDGDTEDR